MTDRDTRMHKAAGNPAPLCRVESQIENILNARRGDGTYKGYAIITFKSPEAAALALKAVNREGNFIAKIDQDYLPESPTIQAVESVSKKVNVGRIPSHFTRLLFLRIVENCIPRSLYGAKPLQT
jgi:hypothetical protein